MSYQSEDLVAQLRNARESRGISQRALSGRTGMTQSHISNIESGTVEPGLSSLITLARALEQELILVPRKLVPAVEGIMQAQTKNDLSPKTGTVAMELLQQLARRVTNLQSDQGGSKDLDRIANALVELQSLPLRMTDVLTIQKAVDALKRDLSDTELHTLTKRYASELTSIRNSLVHERPDAPRPAYGNDDEEDGDA